MRRRMAQLSPTPRTVTCVLGLFAMLLSLEGCFFFRSKPDPKAQEITSRLSPGLTTDEVMNLLGHPNVAGRIYSIRKKSIGSTNL